MESKSIKSLPNEILLKIFKMLDGRSNLSSVLVCKRWNDIICNSTAASNSMKLVVKPFNSSKEVNALRRKFSAIKLLEFTEKTAKVFKTLELSSKLSIKHLDLSKSSLECESIVKLLSPFENLDTVVINGSYLAGQVKTVSSLTKIKHIDLNMSSSELLMLFSASQITSLDIWSHLYGTTDYLVPFLASQTKLETFSISLTYLDLNRFFSDECSSKLESAKFKLKQLTIILLGSKKTPQSNVESNMIKLLTQHASHIETLVLKGKFTPSIYETIFTKFNSLKKLTLDHLPKSKSACKQLISFRSRQQLLLFNGSWR